ncbi:DegT/DnrJ/EryC1/StrS family aminotransferase [Actinoplanes auranticolor]|uniref:Aminotransferase DegT n=1 Tax=Actinoplanes auranticolor TaxID=47988 RepID=A0A919W1B9_9ACTN|nr:DegT/DnrJ/EryC1/StrS family aminotransferase [Actinoplanes auranticolor]GIM76363.1 aminotransferase DegT [Actinoplanes auranticolor]
MSVWMPLSRPTLGPQEERNVADALSSGWISGTGPYVERFEAAVSAHVGRGHTVAVSSGTTALELVLAALGVGPGDEVIVPALTFAAPAAAVCTVGATPVLCDVSSTDWTLDPAAAAALVTARTSAVIAVDLLGHPADYSRLASLGVPVIEDAAQAHGAVLAGRPAGSFGDISIFSFHANKAVTTGEGGGVCTDDTELADRVRLLGNHGMTAERPYWHEVAGRNARMTNLTAALGLAQAERWGELVAGRMRADARYGIGLAPLGLGTRPVRVGASPSCWLHTVVTDPGTRDLLVSALRRASIDARAVWPALTELPRYRGFAPHTCPVAEQVSRSCAWLPTWSDITDEEIATVLAEVATGVEELRLSARDL